LFLERPAVAPGVVSLAERVTISPF